MNAEIIAVGDELTSGVRVDTNSAWLSRRLHEIGIRVRFHTTVADDRDACRDAFTSALKRADLILATGGLGPTADDLTRPALADAVGKPLEVNPDALAAIEHVFHSRGRDMPPQNVRQAEFPQSSQPIPNRHGTAPGIDLVHVTQGRSARVFALPGVPAEMREMWQDWVLPELRRMGAVRGVAVIRELKCFGVGESHLESQLPDLIQRGRDPSVGITVHQATITLRIMTAGEDLHGCQQRVDETAKTIRAALGDIVFGEGDTELEHVVVELLNKKKASVAVFEWGTPGIIGRWLRQANSKQAFAGGYVCSGDENQPAAWLPAELLKAQDDGDLLEKQVNWLADETRRRFAADYGIAVGPIREKDLTDPNAKVAVAISTPTSVEVTLHRIAGHPSIVLERTAKFALNRLRLCLLR